jgi:hypothetical protein
MPRNIYEGKTKKLVVAIDVGTTVTTAAFCFAQPGEVPQFNDVRPIDLLHTPLNSRYRTDRSVAKAGKMFIWLTRIP